MNATIETPATEAAAVETPVGPFVYQLTPAEYVATVEKIEKINARAAKKALSGRLVVTGVRTEKTETNAAGIDVTTVWYETTVTGKAPSYDGWEFVATLDWDAHAGLVVRTSPGVDSVDRGALVEDACDHCGTKRRRKETYLVRNIETGEQKQVASSCIKDFLGIKGRPVFIDPKEGTADLDGMIGGLGGRELAFSTESVLAVAWAATMAFGFVSASAFDGKPTKSVVLDVLDPPRMLNDRMRQDHARMVAAIAEHAEAAAAKGVEVREFIASDDFAGSSEYVLNLKAIAGADLASARNIGILASAPQAWAKHTARTLIRKAKEGKPSEWFGAVKDKVEFTGIIESIRYIDGTYSVTTLYTIRNEESGQIVKWFASNSSTLGGREGVTVTIKGAIKKHEEFQGIKSTVLTRCKKIDD